MKLCAVSVDLDEIPNYFRIHGLDEGAVAGDAQTPGGVTAVYDVAVDRLRSMARAAGFPVTFFAVGADLKRPEAARKLRACRDEGHEIANHTQDHRYDLTCLERGAIVEQIDGGARLIEAATGARPAGFRAPGYTITDSVFDVLRELGVEYDSSVFPCPTYYAAKALARAAIALRGRTSRSVSDTPHVLRAPCEPYQVGRPYYVRGDGLVELPIQVTRGLRLPFIGTSITLGGPLMARALARMCLGDSLVNIELHGIDVLDADDGLDALRPHQPDVRIAVPRKLAALHAAFEVFRRAGYTFVTLNEASVAVRRASR